ncbi:MAG: glycosyltransferase family 2 protein, partial [Terriglobales bacterium]
QRRRWLRESFYGRWPLFVRPFLYWIYRYIFRLGFLDGRQGLVFHFLQGCWFRLMIDVKIYELRKRR